MTACFNKALTRLAYCMVKFKPMRTTNSDFKPEKNHDTMLYGGLSPQEKQFDGEDL